MRIKVVSFLFIASYSRTCFHVLFCASFPVAQLGMRGNFFHAFVAIHAQANSKQNNQDGHQRNIDELKLGTQRLYVLA